MLTFLYKIMHKQAALNRYLAVCFSSGDISLFNFLSTAIFYSFTLFLSSWESFDFPHNFAPLSLQVSLGLATCYMTKAFTTDCRAQPVPLLAINLLEDTPK